MTNNLKFEHLPQAVAMLTKEIKELKQLLAPQKEQPLLETNPPRRKLNAKDSAAYLGISLPTFYSKSSKREIPVYKAPGTKLLFCFEDELEEFIKKGKRQTNAEIQAKAEEYLTKKGGLKNE